MGVVKIKDLYAGKPDAKDEIDGNNADGKVTPAEVWAVLSNQAPSTDVETAEEENTDIKQG